MASSGQEPYDPYIPSGGAQGAGNSRTQALQAVSDCLFNFDDGEGNATAAAVWHWESARRRRIARTT